jgi:NhaP-type Na+/H+ or K+/H+ antiporter
MVYQDIVILAGFIFIYSLVATRVEKTALSGPVLAVVVGLLVGPVLLGFFNVKINEEGYRVLAELALALVLFTDAANTNLRVLKHNIKVPARLLLIGLPLTILFGVVAGFLIFNGFSWIEVCILATMLAPTDAALGKAVVTNPKVPSRIREALNVESGLNDGISVPVLFLFIAIFTAESAGDVNFMYGLGLFAEQIGIGLVVGLSIAFVGDRFIHFSAKRNWISLSWKPVVIIALALFCFASAQLFGGSGFIACFSGGLLYGYVNRKHKFELLEAAEGIGDTLSLTTWGIFGALIIPKFFHLFTWDIILYALLSLTAVRMIPVFISLINTGFSFKEKLFMAWFGPRGLASIVFAIIVLDVHMPHLSIITTTVVCTILLSIIAHGISAIPFIKYLNKYEQK